MEIGSIDFEEDLYEEFSVQKRIDPLHEKVGRAVSIVFFFIACAAMLPAMFSKKKTIQIITPSLETSSIIEEPLPDQSDLPPLLRCTEEDRKKIIEVFGTVANGGVSDLVWNARHLINEGEKLERVHPFALFLNMPREIMVKIFTENQWFKQTRMNKTVGGIEKGFHLFKGQIDEYIPLFADKMEKDPQTIKRLIQEKKWQDLAYYLFDISS